MQRSSIVYISKVKKCEVGTSYFISAQPHSLTGLGNHDVVMTYWLTLQPINANIDARRIGNDRELEGYSEYFASLCGMHLLSHRIKLQSRLLNPRHSIQPA